MIRTIDTSKGITLYITDILSTEDDGCASQRERERKASRRLIRQAFGESAAVRHDPDGAPLLSGIQDPYIISISHSSRTCVLAVSRHHTAIGVDIELPRNQLYRIRNKFLSEEECEYLSAIENDIAGSNNPGDCVAAHDKQMDFLLHCWTAKEAVYKCAHTPGLGLKEIMVSSDFSSAKARGLDYALHYDSLPDGQLICCTVLPL